MYSKIIKTCSLPYGWQEAVKFVRESKHELIFGGVPEVKYALDSQVQIILDNHAIEDALKHIVHPSDPFCTDSNGNPSENRIMTYVDEYNKKFDATKFSYTYYGELTKNFIRSSRTDNEIDNTIYVNLISKLREGLRFQIESTYVNKDGRIIKGLPSNRNVITLLDNTKWGMMDSLPCWNILWIRLERIDENGVAWVSVNTWYRSHDLTDAWESNFIAQVTMVVKEILEPLNAKILYWKEDNASLHIYRHNLDLANKIKIISVSPYLINLQKKYEN
jgi:hypothetical protein